MHFSPYRGAEKGRSAKITILKSKFLLRCVGSVIILSSC